MSSDILTGLLLIGIGTLFVFGGLPLARGNVSRNPFIGFRTRTIGQDERIWYPVNTMMGIWLIWAGTLAAIIGLLLLILHNHEAAQRLVLGIGVPAFVVCLVLGIYRGWRLASAIDAQIHRQELEQSAAPDGDHSAESCLDLED
jgi:uncharacterized membrane protein